MAAPAKSIAVLPLENLSDDKENAFFADGIQDDLLTSLAKIKDLKVISRTSVMSYRNKGERNLREIGMELGVANVLEGSVRRAVNRVLVNVQLIDTASDQNIWSERYDRTLADSITLQGELASEIAGALHATLTAEEKARVEAKSTDSPDAYVAYLKGRELELRPERSRENFLNAESFYKQAIALDPKFVLARARLSLVQTLHYEYFEPTNAARLAEARANAEEALRLDPNSAEAHSSLARCAQNANDAATTRRELDASVRLLPTDASILLTAAVTQWGMGWNDEAVVNFKRANELGPREAKNFYTYGVLLKQMDREAEARAALDRALVLAPESIYYRLQRASAEISWTGIPNARGRFWPVCPPARIPTAELLPRFARSPFTNAISRKHCDCFRRMRARLCRPPIAGVSEGRTRKHSAKRSFVSTLAITPAPTDVLMPRGGRLKSRSGTIRSRPTITPGWRFSTPKWVGKNPPWTKQLVPWSWEFRSTRLRRSGFTSTWRELIPGRRSPI